MPYRHRHRCSYSKRREHHHDPRELEHDFGNPFKKVEYGLFWLASHFSQGNGEDNGKDDHLEDIIVGGAFKKISPGERIRFWQRHNIGRQFTVAQFGKKRDRRNSAPLMFNRRSSGRRHQPELR